MNALKEDARKRMVREHMRSSHKRLVLLQSMLTPAQKLTKVLLDDGLGVTVRRQAEREAKVMLRVAEQLVGRMEISGEAWREASSSPWIVLSDDPPSMRAKGTFISLREAYRKSVKIDRTPAHAKPKQVVASA